MTQYKKIQRFTYRLLRVARKNDSLSLAVDIFIQALIIINVIIIIIETIKPIYIAYEHFFYAFDIFSCIIFTIEYILRIWSYALDPRFKEPLKGRLRLMLRPMLIIDLLAIAPFYISKLITIDLRILRILRLFRLLRLLKLARYVKAMKTIIEVIIIKKEELMISIIAFAMILILASSLIFIIEHPHQPDLFSSIPSTMWWGMAALTTVGYGDIYPITPIGQFLGACLSFVGIGIFALPTGILASGMIEIAKKNKSIICKHCGKRVIND